MSIWKNEEGVFMVRGGVRELLFKTLEEQMAEEEYTQKYLEHNWFYHCLPFIVCVVAIVFMLFTFSVIKR